MKLHIGGEEKKDGWKILNIQQKNDVDFIGDISDLSQFDESSIDEIYASHIVEHVDQNKLKKTLKGIHRILKNNGKFYISVPDMDVLCRIFMAKEAPKKKPKKKQPKDLGLFKDFLDLVSEIGKVPKVKFKINQKYL